MAKKIEERKEARERVINTLINNLPDIKDNGVHDARKSDIRGYDIVLQLDTYKKNNVNEQLHNILEQADQPYLYNRTNYKADFARYDVKIGLEVYMKIIIKETD